MYLITIISHYSVGVLTQVFNEDTLRTIKPQNPQPFTEAGSFKVLLRAKVRSIRTPPQSLFLVVNKYKYVNRVINIMDVTEKKKKRVENKPQYGEICFNNRSPEPVKRFANS